MKLRRQRQASAMAVGFTGTQIGMSTKQKAELRNFLGEIRTLGYNEFHHGDCIGADTEAHHIAKKLGYRIIVHPPDVTGKQTHCKGHETRTPKPYLVRNRDIVDETLFMIATPKDEKREELRSGTWSTVRYARGLGRQIVVLAR